MYAIDLPNDPESKALVDRVLESLGTKFNDGLAHVDTQTSNASRVAKVIGTTAGKGDSTPGQPHRQSRIISRPETLQVVTREQLEKLAAECVPEPRSQPNTSHAASRANCSWLDDWLEQYRNKLPPLKDKHDWHHSGWIREFECCPWNPEHQNGSAFIGQQPGGAVVAGCRHDSCAQENWRTLRAKVEGPRTSSHSRGKSEPSASAVADDKTGIRILPVESETPPVTSTTEATILDGAKILDEVRAFISRYMKMTEAQVTAVALWAAHTYVAMVAIWTPYLAITSAEKRCAKSRLMEVLRYLVRAAWLIADATPAAMFRKIEKERPTLFLDESDALFKGDKEKAQAIRGILNAGAHHLGVVSRCDGKDHNPRDFSVFCPKAVLGIGVLPDTVADRSLPIRMKRKRTTEKVERLREKLVEPLAKPLRNSLAHWIIRIKKDLEDAEPTLPEQLDDRQQDGAEPLLAIADAAGGDWPAKARAALIELYTGGAAHDESLGVKLLADIREIFGEEDQILSAGLVQGLNAKEISPWAESGKTGKGLTAHSLAGSLKPFEIGPKQIRIGEVTGRGYVRADFTDAWERFLHPSSPPKPANLTPPLLK